MRSLKKIKILLGAPGNTIQGGISAVVTGIIKCFDLKVDLGLSYKIYQYGRLNDNHSFFRRIIVQLWQIICLIKEIVFFNPNIVHVQSSFDKRCILRDSIHLWISHLFFKKFVLHAHGGVWHEIAEWNWFWQKYSKLFLRKCDAIIVTSETEKRIIQNTLQKTDHLYKISNPLIISKDIINYKLHIYPSKKSGKFKIVFSSRLIKSKGITDLVNSVYFLERTDIEIDIYGDGPLKSEISYLLQQIDNKRLCILKGVVSLEELITAYLHCDIYVFPSYHNEGFPMAFFYALASGAPIITTKVRPIPDFLIEPDNCLWIEQNNPKMIAQKINILLDDKGTRLSMSKNNMVVARQFDPSIISDQLYQLYSTVIFS